MLLIELTRYPAEDRQKAIRKLQEEGLWDGLTLHERAEHLASFLKKNAPSYERAPFLDQNILYHKVKDKNLESGGDTVGLSLLIRIGAPRISANSGNKNEVLSPSDAQQPESPPLTGTLTRR